MCEKEGFKKGRWLVCGAGTVRKPGLLLADASPVELLDPRPAAFEPPLELDDDDLLPL